MSLSDYNKGSNHAYYGYPAYYNDPDYQRGYQETITRLEEEEMEREYSKAMEKEMMEAMQQEYYEEMWLLQYYEYRNSFDYE